MLRFPCVMAALAAVLTASPTLAKGGRGGHSGSLTRQLVMERMRGDCAARTGLPAGPGARSGARPAARRAFQACMRRGGP